MNFKTTIALVVVALAMGGAVFWQNQQQATATPTPFTLPNSIFGDVRTAQIGRIEVRQGDRMVAAEKNNEDKWTLVQPAADYADGARLDSFVSSFVNVRSSRVLTDAAAVAGNLPQYGLDRPDVVVQANVRDAGTIRLSVGGESPAGGTRYSLKDGSNNIYLINRSVVSDWIKLVTDPPRATPTATPSPTPEATPTPGS